MRYCTTIRVASASSVGQALSAKFQGTRELNVSNVQGGVGVGVTLLSLDINSETEEMIVHVHSRSSSSICRPELTMWLTAWLCDTLDENDVAIATSPVHAFPQARPSIAPLSPLRERGCIVVPIGQPAAGTSITGTETTTDCCTNTSLLVICGDWAVAENAGTVSGALLSAYKGAREVAEHLNHQSKSRKSSQNGAT